MHRSGYMHQKYIKQEKKVYLISTFTCKWYLMNQMVVIVTHSEKVL